MQPSFSSETTAWYVVYCNPCKEGHAAQALHAILGLTVYLPEMQRWQGNRVQHVPLFPRYLFVQADLQVVAISQIHTMPGVIRLVTFDEEPRPVAATVIAELRKQLDEFNARGAVPPPVQPGDTVRLKRGPLRGLEAVFLGPWLPSERVRILLDFLGGEREVLVDADMLEIADNVSAARPPRRTRGRGRRITPYK